MFSQTKSIKFNRSQLSSKIPVLVREKIFNQLIFEITVKQSDKSIIVYYI